MSGRTSRLAWQNRLAALEPQKRAEFERRIGGELAADKLTAAVRAVKENLAAAPKEIATFPRAGHSDHHLFGSYDEVFRWVDALESKAHMREYDPRIEGAAQ